MNTSEARKRKEEKLRAGGPEHISLPMSDYIELLKKRFEESSRNATN